ncbi:hypothetical protein IV203_000931 [Nitzschia inconspicua]|uniref:Sulfotransferase n=1 Tax=Nitzschia inconspicua TaxID=303405 RepID=A0A9K3PQH7_9STRA|nr:hypothetical protein IV203_000931 [Nitzschia inconspicua]
MAAPIVGIERLRFVTGRKAFAIAVFLAVQGAQIGLLVLMQRNSGYDNNRNLQSRRQQGQQIPYQWPVILMGLPNSGSMTLHEYFECHGLISRHYCCDSDMSRVKFPCGNTIVPKSMKHTSSTCGECVWKNMKRRRRRRRIHPFAGCHIQIGEKVQVWASFDVETRSEWFLPQHFAIGVLHQAYPNATWILQKRSDPQEWAESILRWQSKTKRFFSSYQLPLYPYHVPIPLDASSLVTVPQIVQDMELSLEQRIHNHTDHLRKRNALREIYVNHTQQVRRWARQYQSHHLIEINVDTDDPQIVLQGLLQSLNTTHNTKCSWPIRQVDENWRDFRLQFEI